MARHRHGPEAAVPLVRAANPGAAWGVPRGDFRVPGPHGLVVFERGRRALVEPPVRRLLPADAPIDWEE